MVGHEEPTRVDLRPHRTQPVPGVGLVGRAGVGALLGEVEEGPAARPRLQCRDEPLGVDAAAGGQLGVGAIARKNPAYAPWSRDSAPPPGWVRPSAPPSWRSSAESSDDVDPGPTSARSAATASSGSASSTIAPATAGVGPSGSMCSRVSDAEGTRAKVSSSGPSARSGSSSGLRRGVVGEHGPVDDHDLAAADEVGQLRHRREAHDPQGGGDLVGAPAPTTPPTPGRPGVRAHGPRAASRRRRRRSGGAGTPRR